MIHHHDDDVVVVGDTFMGGGKLSETKMKELSATKRIHTRLSFSKGIRLTYANQRSVKHVR
jgi:hypothetical protein